MDIHPITLIGKIVRLEPLSVSHVPDLTLVGQDERIWQYMVYKAVKTESQMLAWVLDLLNLQEHGTDLPFAVILVENNKAIGATRYLNINHKYRSLEIGGTWYGVDYQGSLVNSECKYLLLRHAFEILDCVRVQLKTDIRNKRSQLAIERLGATKEGILRNHMILLDGTLRHSILYSILPEEWLNVKENLEERLGYS